MRIVPSNYKIPLATPGEGVSGKTGLWKWVKPVIDVSKCVRCFLCEIYCPDNTIVVDPEKGPSINYEYCKGCGVCAAVCSKGAIKMVKEEVMH